jgi:hypothetical protein
MPTTQTCPLIPATTDAEALIALLVAAAGDELIDVRCDFPPAVADAVHDALVAVLRSVLHSDGLNASRALDFSAGGLALSTAARP